MTKIKNYELDSTINDEDKVIGTDGLPGADFGKTKNYSIASLVAYIDTQLDPVDGSGTLNTIPIWTPDGDTLGDSIMTYDTGNTAITVAGKLIVTGTGIIQGNLSAASLNLQGTLTDVNGQFGTAGQLLSSTGTAVDWVDAPVSGVQGSGTLNTLPMWTPDGATLGDSIITYNTGGAFVQIGSGSVRLTSSTINTPTLIATDVFTTNITAGATGTVSMIGNVVVGDQGTDILTVNSRASFQDQVTLSGLLFDYNSSSGTSGQVLTSTGSGNVTWANSVLGSGTVNTIAMFTPNGSTIGNSVLTYAQSGGIDTVSISGDLSSTRLLTGDIFCNNISAGGTGTVSMVGNVVVGDQGTDILTVNSRTSFQAQVTLDSLLFDYNSSSGTADQVLTSTGSGNVAWANNINTTYDLTGAVSGGTDYTVTLTGSDATADAVVLKAGNSITLTDDGVNGVTIAATGGAANTTYQLNNTQNASNTLLTLLGSDAASTSYTFAAGSGVTFDQTVAGTTTVNTASDNVTGTGTTNYVTKWLGSNTIQDSLIFDNGSFVGIGTASPTAKLEVAGDAILTGGDILLGDNTTVGKVIANHDQLHLLFSDNTGTGIGFINIGNVIRVNASNNVGIGTTTPAAKLDVFGNYSVDGKPFASFESTSNRVQVGDVDGLGIDFEVLGSQQFSLLKTSGTTLELGSSAVTPANQVTMLSPVWIKNSLKDGSQSPGTAGQVLTSTATQTSWVDAVSLFGGAGTENTGVLWGPNGTLTSSLLKHGTGVNSIGLGLDNDSQGLQSIAFTKSTAKADYSFALGYESVTDGQFSVALGRGSYTAGAYSMATNYKSLALGQSSFAGGHTSATGGDGAVALGHNASSGNYGAATLVSTLPNGQTQFDIQGIVGSVTAGLYMRYGEGLEVPDPRFEVLTFTDNGNNSATITIPSPGIRPIQGELVVFEQQTPFRGDHQGGVAMGNDAFSLGEGAVSIGHKSVAEVDKAVALGDSARSSGLSSVAIGKNATATAADTIALGGNSTKILMTALAASASYANDSEAAAGGVSIAELYRNGNAVQIRLT